MTLLFKATYATAGITICANADAMIVLNKTALSDFYPEIRFSTDSTSPKDEPYMCKLRPDLGAIWSRPISNLIVSCVPKAAVNKGE